MEIRQSDIVIVRLDLVSTQGGTPFQLERTLSVADLGLAAAPKQNAPEFDNATFATLLASGDEAKREQALGMLAAFQDATAAYAAQGGVTPAEQLASAVVRWVVENRPGGNNFVTSAQQDGYVISEREINVVGPVAVGDTRAFRVTAVGTWG